MVLKSKIFLCGNVFCKTLVAHIAEILDFFYWRLVGRQCKISTMAES